MLLIILNSMESWRFLDTGVRKAHENIALDDSLLKARSESEAKDTFRLLRYSPAAVLVGFHQSIELEIRESFCRENNIDINRRITGGGAILFDESQIGWEVIASRNLEFIPKKVDALYEMISKVGIITLKNFGIKACFRPRNDIEVNGRKISGTGGTLEGDAFLFQGTLLVDFDAETMLKALRIPTEKLKDKEIDSIKDRVTCLRWELGYTPEYNEIKEALLDGFTKVFKVQVEEGEITEREKKLYRKAVREFSSEEWIYTTRRNPENRFNIYSAKKTEGGLIRLNLIVDIKSMKIHFAIITGDFFAFPKRTIFDLEARLKDHTLEIKQIEKTINKFFDECNPDIPGIEAKDFVDVFSKATEKLSLLENGFTLEDVNKIYTVAGSYDKINNAEVLLLPYCSKAKECDLRYKNDCRKCGKCSVGKAYEMAEKLNLEPITIVNYEHLEKTLSSLKKKGYNAFYGSCCESFYIKHYNDFERIGLKGILVDIENTTCYDLDRVKEAHKGKFKEQTELNLKLLGKLLSKKSEE